MPTHLAIIFDKSEITFRNKLYPDYKAHRPPAPDDLIPQFALIRDAVRAFDLPSLEQGGFEADEATADHHNLLPDGRRLIAGHRFQEGQGSLGLRGNKHRWHLGFRERGYNYWGRLCTGHPCRRFRQGLFGRRCLHNEGSQR